MAAAIATPNKGGSRMVSDFREGEKVSRPLGETVHATRPREVINFDFLYADESGPLGGNGSEEGEWFHACLGDDGLFQQRFVVEVREVMYGS